MKKNKLEDILNELKKETDFMEPLEKETDDFKKFTQQTESEKDVIKNYNNTFYDLDYKNVSSKFNVVWAENKETLLFSVLSSIIVIMIGFLSGYDYIIIGGFLAFILFSVLIFFTFFKYVTVVSAKAKIPQDLINKIETLERKVEFLLRKDIKTPQGKVEKIEEEVREIKLVLKSVVDSIKKQ